MFIFPSISYKYDNDGKNSYKIRLQRTKYLYWTRYAFKELENDHTSRRYILQDLLSRSKQASYKTNVALLLSVPGIGLITAMTLLTEIEDVSRFKTSDQFCAYIGLVPMTTHQGNPTGFTG